MKSVLRFTLLGFFAAAGIGLAVSLALHTESLDQAAWLPAALPEFSRASSTRAASGETADDSSEPPSALEPALEPTQREEPAPLRNEAPKIERTSLSPQETNSPAVLSPSPPPNPQPHTPAAAVQETTYQLAIAQQMGRIEEKLRRAEELAERQQQSIETALTSFQQPALNPLRVAAAQSDELRPAAPAEEGLELPNPGAGASAPVAPLENDDSSSPASPPAPVEPLPAPGRTAETHIVPDEGDGRLTLNLKHSDLRHVLDLLSGQYGMNVIASPTVSGTVTAKLTNVDIDTALDAVLKASGFVARREGNVIYVATPEEFLAMDQAHDRINTRVYRPNYITAAEMKTLLTPIMSPAPTGAISVSTAAQIGIAADSAAAGGDSFSGAEVVLVQDYESVLKRIDQLLLEVDCRPLQVAIEAMIINVTLDDGHEFGVNFALFREHVRLGDEAAVDGLAAAPGLDGLTFAFLESTVPTFLKALETVGDTNVVAAPRVMVLNKQRAEILIGSQLGYVSTTVTENAATQSVEFLEVGTQLRIRPFISSDGMIRLEVHPELSTGSVDVSGGFTLPNKSVTQVTTNIMCRDGATVVLGGLIREDLNSTSTQIPVLGALPLVGAAFRQKSEELTRVETIVLLTPRVVSASTAAAEGAQGKTEYLRRQEVRYDKMSPLAQRYYGKQYQRKARAAWNAGDPSVALRYANLAIHFDPENLDAINLRAEIVETAHVGDRSVEMHLREGLAPWGHPHVEYSRHGAPWKEYPGPDLVVGEPPEPGLPGKVGNLEPAHLPPEPHPPLPLNPSQPDELEEIPEVVVPTPILAPPGQ